jgi:hypothetical protein
MATCDLEIFGADPLNIKWNVVRGDTAVLRVEFYDPDEVTEYDTDGWEYEATAYDYKADVTDTLEVEYGEGYVEIIADPTITKNWGTGYRKKVAELAFDLQVTIGNTVWTPVVGTISVTGDVTGGSL